jgi:hypothetical protein
MDVIRPIDRDKLRSRVQAAAPFPNFCIDGFLDDGFARRVHDALPSPDEAARIGRSFSAVNEKGKVQVTDAGQFAEPVAELNRVLADAAFLDMLSYAFDIPGLVADDQLVGGGIHQTNPRGRLDVHVDFNYLADRGLHRRLNILVYFNPDWQPDWGGAIELWDEQVRHCARSFAPVFNRCVVFATGETSYHGVTAVRCPAGHSRKSFAAYYYTRDAPPGWDGRVHSTRFKARPNEVIKGAVLMPLEQAGRRLRGSVDRLKKALKR